MYLIKRLCTAVLLCCFWLNAPAMAEQFPLDMPTVHITADSLTDWAGKEDVRQALLSYHDPATGRTFSKKITIRPQGTSSLWYDKRNFTIVMQDQGEEMLPGWCVQSEYCLKANYIDPTHAGNVVSAKLVGQMNQATGLYEGLPNRGAIDGFPVWVTLNGVDEGVYTWNIPKGGWMFGMDEGNENHIVMCCEGWSEGCTLQQDYFVLDEDWSIEFGPATSKTIVKFDRLMDFVVNSSDEEFVVNFDQYLNLDACLNYYCFICITNANDNEAKNMLMVTWDGQIWQPMLYDLDSLWGIDSGGMELTTELATSLVYSSNRLFQRIWENFNPQLKERYAMLRRGVLSEENIWRTFEEFSAAIPAEVMEWETLRWNADGAKIRTLDLMKEQVAIYLPLIDAEFEYYPE